MATQRAESGAHIYVARMLLRSNPKGEGVFFTSPTSHTHFAGLVHPAEPAAHYPKQELPPRP